MGAEAVALHGHARFSADVDVTIEEPVDLAEIVAKLSHAGFVPRVPAPVEFFRRNRALPFLHRPTGMPIDVVLAGPGLEIDFLARVVRKDVGRLRVPVLSLEDLVVTKVIAGREKDLEDIRALAALHAGALRRAQVTAVLRAVGEALGEDLVQRFQAVWRSRAR